MKLDANDLIILTDGSCGSTCGMFVSLMQYLKKAKVVSVGGIKGQKMDVASFKGASVLSYQDIQNLNKQLQATCPVSNPIKNMPSPSIGFTVSWMEMYPWTPPISAYERSKQDTNYPLDLTQNPADFHVDTWEFQNPEYLYQEAAKFFDECTVGFYKTSP